jgi:hypothetical protein
MASGRGKRIGASLQALLAEARTPKGSGPFRSCLTDAHRATGCEAHRDPLDRTAGDDGHVLSQLAMERGAGTGRPGRFGNADAAQQAERDHAIVEATCSKLVIRSTSGVSSHSVAACPGVGGAGCARPGPGSRAARHRIRRDDSRLGTAEVEWLSMPPSLGRQSSRLASGRVRVQRVAGGARDVVFV